VKRKFVVSYNSKRSSFCANCNARLGECPAYKSMFLFLKNTRNIHSKLENETKQNVKTIILDILSVGDANIAKKKLNCILANHMQLLCAGCCDREK
jgi:hypothetical protein